MSKKKKAGSGKSGNKKADKKQKLKASSASGKKAAKGSSAKKSSKQPKKADKNSGKKSAVASSKKPAKALKPKASRKTIVKKPIKSGTKSKTTVKKAAPAKPKAKIVKKQVKKPEIKISKAKPEPKIKKVIPAKTAAPKKTESSVPAQKIAPKTLTAPVAKPAAALVTEKPKKSEENAASKKDADKKNASEVLAITNTIPVAQKSEISASKIASISHSITNPIKRTDSYAVKVEKEPNGKFEMEFVVHCSAEMLYEFLSTPSGLSEWFCDDLNIRNGIYTFIWEDQMQQARLLKTLELQVVRFQWVDKTDGSYFEFRIQRDDLTNDISLIITDFAETVSERESSKLLWHSQIEKLMHVIGSIF